MDSSTRNAAVQFKYNNGSVETKSFVLNRSGVSEFSLSVLPCFIYYVRVMPLLLTLLVNESYLYMHVRIIKYCLMFF